MTDPQSPNMPTDADAPSVSQAPVPISDVPPPAPDGQTNPEGDATPESTGRKGFGGKLLVQVDQIRFARIIFGVVSLGVSIAYAVNAAGMPQGTAQQPGPGLWPLAVGIAWVVISIIVILEAAFTQQVEGDLEIPHGIYGRDVITFSVATVIYVVLLPIVGQYIAGSLYCVALVKMLGRVKWWKALLYGLVMAIGISWIFLNLLQVRLPAGDLLKAMGI